MRLGRALPTISRTGRLRRHVEPSEEIRRSLERWLAALRHVVGGLPREAVTPSEGRCRDGT